MRTSSTNSNEKSGKRPASRYHSDFKGLKLLYRPSTVIEVGAYAGMTFGHILKHYGKKAFPELLRYYRISSKIMREYHCRLAPHVEKPLETESVSANNNVPVYVEEEVLVLTNVTGPVEKEISSGDAHDPAHDHDHDMTSPIELDDNKWTVSRSDYESDVLYDPEDDVPDSFIDGLLAREGMAHSGANGKWDWENAEY